MEQTPTESYCFYETAVKREENSISEDVYLQDILSHCNGIRNDKDQLCNKHDPKSDESKCDKFGGNLDLYKIDLFTSKIAEWMAYNVDQNNPVHDIDPIHKVLKAFRANDANEFEIGLDAMDRTYYKEHERKPGDGSLSWSLCYTLAIRALEERKLEILVPLLAKAPYPHPLVQSQSHGIKANGLDPELIRVIDETGVVSTWLAPENDLGPAFWH